MEGVRRRLTLAALMLFSALTAAAVAETDYVGNAACAGCHEQANADWTDSHHDLAMQEATPETVLGDNQGGARRARRDVRGKLTARAWCAQ